MRVNIRLSLFDDRKREEPWVATLDSVHQAEGLRDITARDSQISLPALIVLALAGLHVVNSQAHRRDYTYLKTS